MYYIWWCYRRFEPHRAVQQLRVCGVYTCIIYDDVIVGLNLTEPYSSWEPVVYIHVLYMIWCYRRFEPHRAVQQLRVCGVYTCIIYDDVIVGLNLTEPYSSWEPVVCWKPSGSVQPDTPQGRYEGQGQTCSSWIFEIIWNFWRGGLNLANFQAGWLMWLAYIILWNNIIVQ